MSAAWKMNSMKIMTETMAELSGDDWARLTEAGIGVIQVFPGSIHAMNDWTLKTWVLCDAPWAQYNRARKPGTYMDSFDGDIEAFIARYRKCYPVHVD